MGERFLIRKVSAQLFNTFFDHAAAYTELQWAFKLSLFELFFCLFYGKLHFVQSERLPIGFKLLLVSIKGMWL